MMTVKDPQPEVAGLTALVICVNSDWSGYAIVTWGFKNAKGQDDSRTCEIRAPWLLQGMVQLVDTKNDVIDRQLWHEDTPREVIARAIALACTHHATHRCQEAIERIGMPKIEL